MAWLDSVLCVPLVGLQTVPDFKIAADYRRIIAPLINEMSAMPKGVEIGEGKGWAMEIAAHDGYRVRLTPTDIVVEFKYADTVKHLPGQLPTLEPRALMPYMKLLQSCISRIGQIVNLILENKYELRIQRIGIVAHMALDPANLPPGVHQMFTHLGSPWAGSMIKCDSLVLAEIDKTDTHKDRCHHILKFDIADEYPQLRCAFDWQRLFTEGQVIRVIKDFEALFNLSRESAEAYFEKIGDGTYGNE